jgi:hypothetical protein
MIAIDTNILLWACPEFQYNGACSVVPCYN